MVNDLIGLDFYIGAKRYVISNRWVRTNKNIRELVITHNNKFVSSLFEIHKTKKYEFYLFDVLTNTHIKTKNYIMIIYDVSNGFVKGKSVGADISQKEIVRKIKNKIRSLRLWK